MDFASLKANRDSLKAQLANDVENTSEGFQKDTRYWRLTTEKDTFVGSATIRFLPPPPGEDKAWVKMYEHAFKGPGGWYINPSRTTLGKNEPDPVGIHNKALWDSEDPAKRDMVSKNYKRRTKYIANIYVVNDPAKPENNGKVFLFKFGPSIYDIIHDAMHPEEGDDAVAVNPFDFWEGTNLVLKSRKKDGFPNYEKSKWEAPSTLEDDKVLEEIWNSQHSLTAEISEDKIPSFEQLQKDFDRAMKITSRRPAVVEEDDDEPAQMAQPAFKQPKTLAAALGEEDDEASGEDEFLASVRNMA